MAPKKEDEGSRNKIDLHRFAEDYVFGASGLSTARPEPPGVQRDLPDPVPPQGPVRAQPLTDGQLAPKPQSEPGLRSAPAPRFEVIRSDRVTTEQDRRGKMVNLTEIAEYLTEWQPTRMNWYQRFFKWVQSALAHLLGRDRVIAESPEVLKGYSAALFHHDPMVIVVAQAKGGVGKTVTALCLATEAATAAADGAIRVILAEAMPASDLAVRQGLTSTTTQASYREYVTANGDPDRQLDRVLVADTHVKNLYFLLAPLNSSDGLSVGEFAEIAELLPRHGDVIIYDTEAAFPAATNDTDSARLRLLLQRAHAILVPIRPEQASILDGARFISECIDELKIDWKKIWVVVTGGELRGTGLDEHFWNRLAPQHHHRIPPARELIEETLRSGAIPVQVSSHLRNSVRRLLRRLLVEYHAEKYGQQGPKPPTA